MARFLVALRANQIMNVATNALTKRELESQSMNGSPSVDGKIDGASSVSADAKMMENDMVFRTSRILNGGGLPT
jgi:hypothetical protein